MGRLALGARDEGHDRKIRSDELRHELVARQQGLPLARHRRSVQRSACVERLGFSCSPAPIQSHLLQHEVSQRTSVRENDSAQPASAASCTVPGYSNTRPAFTDFEWLHLLPDSTVFQFSAWQQMWLDNFDAFFLHAPFVSNSRQMRWRGEWLAYEHFTTCLILSRIQRLGVCLLISPRDFDATPPSPTLRQLDLHMLFWINSISTILRPARRP